MYNAISSFNKYFRGSVLPLLDYSPNLYTDDPDNILYPAILIRPITEEDTETPRQQRLLVQITVVTNDDNARNAIILAEQIQDQLNIKSNTGKTITEYDYITNTSNPDPTGNNVRIIKNGGIDTVVNNDYKELSQIVFDIYLEYTI